MTPIVVVVVAMFLVAFLAMVLVAAIFLTNVAFRFAPILRNSFLSVSCSEAVRIARQKLFTASRASKPVLQMRDQVLVLLAINPLKKQPEYFFGLDSCHRAVFGPNRDGARRFDLADEMLIKKMELRANDCGFEVFLVLADGRPLVKSAPLLGTRKIHSPRLKAIPRSEKVRKIAS